MQGETIWQFETARFRVELIAAPEYMAPADSFEFQGDIAFASDGEPAHWFCAIARVTDKESGAELGRDVLGACSYRSFDEFISSHRSADPENRNTLAMKARNISICHYFPDMVRLACREARQTANRLSGLRNQ